MYSTTIHRNPPTLQSLRSRRASLPQINAPSFQTPRMLQDAAYHLQTLYLFTRSDLYNFVIPQTIVALLIAPSASLFLQPSTGASLLTILSRTPLVLFYIWTNLLAENIFNQISLSSIAEDKLNKPWRPIASGRISRRNAGILMIATYTFCIISSAFLLRSGLQQTLALVVLGTWYNALGGGSGGPLVRGLVNGLGFVGFATGALEVALGQRLLLTGPVVQWFGIIVSIVTATIHTADMEDQEGDGARGRKTMPLVVGDQMARWLIAGGVGFFSLMCPAFWGFGWKMISVYALLGGAIGTRSLTWKTVKSDKLTYAAWNLWLVCVYALPALKWCLESSME